MREIITVTVGESISNNSAVHIDSEGNAYMATLPDRPATGYCKTGASSGLVQVILSGTISASVEALNGAFVYLDNATPGAMTPLKPNGDYQILGRMTDNGLIIEVSQAKINPLNAAEVAYFQ